MLTLCAHILTSKVGICVIHVKQRVIDSDKRNKSHRRGAQNGLGKEGAGVEEKWRGEKTHTVKELYMSQFRFKIKVLNLFYIEDFVSFIFMFCLS